MKIALSAVISMIISAGLMFFLMNLRIVHNKNAADFEKLLVAEQTVQKRFEGLSTQITSQLAAFSEVVAAYKDFSLKILVENDRSSPVVTEMASQFLKPMGFSVLEIADSSWRVLSSGHFPASAGNSSAEKADHLSDKATLCIENIMGIPTLTLQAKTAFSIAGFTFHVAGGLTIDKALLDRLTPAGNVTLVLKKGNEYIGMEGIGSISAIKDHKVNINDKTYFASEIQIPSAGLEEEVSIIVLVGK